MWGRLRLDERKLRGAARAGGPRLLPPQFLPPLLPPPHPRAFGLRRRGSPVGRTRRRGPTLGLGPGGEKGASPPLEPERRQGQGETEQSVLRDIFSSFSLFFFFFVFNVLEKVMSVVEGGELAMLFYLL